MQIYYKTIPPEASIPPLYHYTSPAGMLGMTQYGALWLTNLLYMNDTTEYIWALERIKEKLKLYQVEIDITSENSFTSTIYARCLGAKASIDLANPSKEVGAFSFSLSQRKDSLSQWRGYCPSGGYAISFYEGGNYKGSQFSQMIENYGLHIGKCLYTDNEYETLVSEVIINQDPDKFLKYMDDSRLSEAELARSAKRGQGRYETLQNILERILTYAPFIKHHAFKDEEEWRIVAFNNNQILKHLIKFREGKNFIIPYLEIPLVEKDFKHSLPSVQVGEIVVGPTPHMDLAINSCNQYRSGLSGRITPSEIPYRNW